MKPASTNHPVAGTELQGWWRLPFDTILGLLGVVEAMHRGITRLPGSRAGADPDRTRGLTGSVYGAIRGVTRVADAAVHLGLGQVPPGGGRRSPRREAMLAVLNGVLGDHLVETGNPLAIPMRLRRAGRPLVIERTALAEDLPDARGRVVLLVHGSCLSDLVWLRGGHDHGAALARDVGCTSLYLHYNSGLHVSTNGHALAGLLDGLLREWPVPLARLDVVAHSMGGLVMRSACHHAAGADQAWLGRLGSVVFLGTPHLGAPLERGGRLVDEALGMNRYVAPLARLGQVRSGGVNDLREGSLLDEDWKGPDRTRDRLPRPVPLPDGVSCFAVAGALAGRSKLAERLVGDGLVPVDSALGRSADPARALGLPEARCFVAPGCGHLDLLASREVYQRIRGWLEVSTAT